MKNFFYLLILSLFFTGCFQESKQKLSYDEQSEITGTTSLEVMETRGDLPFQIDSTEYILHPIGEFRTGYEGRSYSFGTSGGSDVYRAGGHYSGDTYRGNLSNIKFQHIESDSLSALTGKLMRINSLSFLRELFSNTGRQILVYEINDRDTNKDEIIDNEDINSLYLSMINGKNFRKITPEDHELLDWRFIPNLNRIYFRTLEDTNRNGKFEKEDVLHNFFLNLETEDQEVIEYYPVN